MSLEKLTTVATLALTVLIGGVLIHDRLLPSRPSRPSTTALVGKPWAGKPIQAGAKATIVLALQTTCHFCDESMPFYQRLTAQPHEGVKIVAVFPQAEAQSREHLAGHAVAVDQVVSQPMAGSGISGTPTLLLLDAHQVVKKAWIGRLDESREAEVIRAITKESL